MSNSVSIPSDVLWPRDRLHRFRIYAVADGRMDVLAAAPTPGGIGQALVTIHEDQKLVGKRLADLGHIGVLDVCAGGPTGEWILLPWPRRTVPATVGPLPRRLR